MPPVPNPLPDPRRAALLLLASALLIAAIGQFTDLDLWFAELHFDRGRNAFPWQSTWFAVDFMHGHVKVALIRGGQFVMALALVDALFRLPFISPLRRVQLRILALSALIEPKLVKLLKDHTYQQCPWSTDLFGGSEPMLRLLDPVPAGMPLGECFPAGHASVAMWLVAIAVFWLPGDRRRAVAAYLGGLSVGLLLGWVQQMRGAHFLTHTLWTAWIASAVFLLLVAALARPLQAGAAAETRQLPAGAAGAAEY